MDGPSPGEFGLILTLKLYILNKFNFISLTFKMHLQQHQSGSSYYIEQGLYIIMQCNADLIFCKNRRLNFSFNSSSLSFYISPFSDNFYERNENCSKTLHKMKNCLFPQAGFKSCKSELKLNVNCRKRFGPAQLLSFNSLPAATQYVLVYDQGHSSLFC